MNEPTLHQRIEALEVNVQTLMGYVRHLEARLEKVQDEKGRVPAPFCAEEES